MTSKKSTIEKYQISHCLREATIDYDDCIDEKNSKCFENGIKEYKTCEKESNFIQNEAGYRQAVKCPCPFDYVSKNTPRIPFI